MQVYPPRDRQTDRHGRAQKLLFALLDHEEHLKGGFGNDRRNFYILATYFIVMSALEEVVYGLQPRTRQFPAGTEVATRWVHAYA